MLNNFLSRRVLDLAVAIHHIRPFLESTFCYSDKTDTSFLHSCCRKQMEGSHPENCFLSGAQNHTRQSWHAKQPTLSLNQLIQFTTHCNNLQSTCPRTNSNVPPIVYHTWLEIRGQGMELDEAMLFQMKKSNQIKEGHCLYARLWETSEISEL